MLEIVITKCKKAEKEGTKSGIDIEMLENAIVQLSKQDAINTLQSVLEPTKTYPVGYDPDGKWVIYYEGNDKLKWVYESIHALDADERAWSGETKSEMGECFTTKEQAEKAAAGKNAMKELIFAIHEFNQNACEKLESEDTEFCIWSDGTLAYGIVDNYSHPEKLRMRDDVADKVKNKLGDETIKLALEWGM